MNYMINIKSADVDKGGGGGSNSYPQNVDKKDVFFFESLPKVPPCLRVHCTGPLRFIIEQKYQAVLWFSLHV